MNPPDIVRPLARGNSRDFPEPLVADRSNDLRPLICSLVSSSALGDLRPRIHRLPLARRCDAKAKVVPEEPEERRDRKEGSSDEGKATFRHCPIIASLNGKCQQQMQGEEKPRNIRKEDGIYGKKHTKVLWLVSR